MKGLLLKDWFVIWKQCRYLLFVPPVFLVVSVLSTDGLFSPCSPFCSPLGIP